MDFGLLCIGTEEIIIKMSQHICFVVPSLDVGGAERSLVKLANAYVGLGQKVTIITFSDICGLQYLLEKTIIVYSISGMSTSNPMLWLCVRQYLRKNNPDVVFGWSLYANLVATLVTARPSKKLIISERNYLPKAIDVRGRRAGLRARMSLLAIRYLYPRADIITANSRQSLRFLQKFVGSGPEYIHLPNMIDVNGISEYAKQKAHDIPDVQGPHILAVGRLCYQKGFDVLLNAFAIIREYHPWSLVIVGVGEEHNNLMQQAKCLGIDNAVFWMGAKENPFPYYKWADLVVVSSRFEGFPNVPLEAMACGTTVICADCKTGPRELTQSGRFGRLVPVGNVEALVEEILALGKDSMSRTVLGDAAQKHISNTYDNRVVQDCLLRLLE